MKNKWRLLSPSSSSLIESSDVEPRSHYYALWGLLTLLSFFLVQRYFGPFVFRVFGDLFGIVFGSFCVVRNEYPARQAARPNKWLFRKDTSDQIPIYRWGYIIGGVFFMIFGVVDLFFRLKSRM
jgi:hypothetical protein